MPDLVQGVMKLLLSLGLLLFAFASQAGTIRGRVTGEQKRESLIGATVLVQGTSLSAPVDEVV